jgi:nitrate reductase delta subunit
MMLWFLIGCSMMPASTKVQPLKKSPAYHEALARVREWTRERFTLAADATILVSEIACSLPGCPPLFKPVREVVVGDFPPAWLRTALAVPDGFECDCC